MPGAAKPNISGHVLKILPRQSFSTTKCGWQQYLLGWLQGTNTLVNIQHRTWHLLSVQYVLSGCLFLIFIHAPPPSVHYACCCLITLWADVGLDFRGTGRE